MPTAAAASELVLVVAALAVARAVARRGRVQRRERAADGVAALVEYGAVGSPRPPLLGVALRKIHQLLEAGLHGRQLLDVDAAAERARDERAARRARKGAAVLGQLWQHVLLQCKLYFQVLGKFMSTTVLHIVLVNF